MAKTDPVAYFGACDFNLDMENLAMSCDFRVVHSDSCADLWRLSTITINLREYRNHGRLSLSYTERF